jgi:hypothetical protein
MLTASVDAKVLLRYGEFLTKIYRLFVSIEILGILWDKAMKNLWNFFTGDKEMTKEKWFGQGKKVLSALSGWRNQGERICCVMLEKH